MTTPPPIEAVAAKGADLARDCAAAKVTDVRSYEQAAHLLLCVAAVRREIGETFAPVIAAAHASHKAALAAKAQHDEPLAQAERVLKGAMGSWRAAEEERARKAALAAQRQAQAIAEAEAKAEADERALQAAIEAEAAGAPVVDVAALAAAELAAAGPVYADPVAAPRAVPAIAGVTARQTWRAEVTDFRALVMAVADGLVPEAALTPNMVFLGQQARSLKGLLRYPGVRACEESTTAVRP